MKYFNGFGLKGEEALFQTYLIDNEHTIIGFSYGAQKALEYLLNTSTRIDRLILLSPAFFNHASKEFKQSQLDYFEQNHNTYIKTFLRNVTYPSKQKLNDYFHTGTKEELSNLLHYEWKEEKVKKILSKGITIEVFLGDKDKIIDYKKTLSFFKSAGCTIYLLKNYGHLLGE